MGGEGGEKRGGKLGIWRGAIGGGEEGTREGKRIEGCMEELEKERRERDKGTRGVGEKRGGRVVLESGRRRRERWCGGAKGVEGGGRGWVGLGTKKVSEGEEKGKMAKLNARRGGGGE